MPLLNPSFLVHALQSVLGQMTERFQVPAVVQVDLAAQVYSSISHAQCLQLDHLSKNKPLTMKVWRVVNAVEIVRPLLPITTAGCSWIVSS